jgi:hypothetical protein
VTKLLGVRGDGRDEIRGCWCFGAVLYVRFVFMGYRVIACMTANKLFSPRFEIIEHLEISLPISLKPCSNAIGSISREF